MLPGWIRLFGLMAAGLAAPQVFAADAAQMIVISKQERSVAIYRGGDYFAGADVSTGKEGHPTPTGIFSILEKRKYHESNIYSNAPMPYMQRLTWSGIALHEGRVPQYPASHGCIRMPNGFAEWIFAQTRYGEHVIVTEAAVAPVRVESANLFRPPASRANILPVSDAPLRLSPIDPTKAAELAMNAAPATLSASAPDAAATQPAKAADSNARPLRILITRRGLRETIRDVQSILMEFGYQTGGMDGAAGPMTRSAIEAYKRARNLSETSARLSEEFLQTLYSESGRQRPPSGQIMVRQNFKPLFEAPVSIRDPETALGTHFFLADALDAANGTARWHAVTLKNEIGGPAKRRLGIGADASDGANAAADAMARIGIPDDVRRRIESLMTSGMSVTIHDEGLGTETGTGTDFIAVTHEPVALTAKRRQAG